MKVTLKVWRQGSRDAAGAFFLFPAHDVTPDMSLFEVVDVVNEGLVEEGKEPIAFDSDCREGICGSCGMVIDGAAHGPLRASASCQVQMRHYRDGDEITLEPWRALPFPLHRDLVVDRGALDRIIASGGYVTAPTGAAPEANSQLIPKPDVEAALDAAACIGCGACVASCPNGSAALFTAAKISHLGLLPQGQPERNRRALAMAAQADQEGFGNCSWHGECEAACPKEISIDTISRMHRDFLKASLAPHEGMRFFGAGEMKRRAR